MVGHVGRVGIAFVIFVIVFASVRGLVLSSGDQIFQRGDEFNHESSTEFWANEWPMVYSNGNEYIDTCGDCHDDVYADWTYPGHGPNEWEGPDGDVALDNVRPGVSCETCHGPALDHLNAKGREEKLSTAPRVEGTSEFCAQCHKELGNPEVGPRTAVPTQGEKHLKRDPCVDCHNPHSGAR